MTYKCHTCGSSLTKRNAEIPASIEGHKRMMRGLGTWRCKQCPYYRRVDVKRFTGSGKESEKGQIESVFTSRHIKVQRKAISKGD